MSDSSKSLCSRCGGRLERGWTSASCPACILLQMTECATVAGEERLVSEGELQTDPPLDQSKRFSSSAGTVPKIIAGYELLDEIGRGGMGIVFRARQTTMHRDVALKLTLRGEYANELDLVRFHLEASTAGNLDHPNIVSIFETGEFDGHAFFSMTLIEGGSLATRRQDWILPSRSNSESSISSLRESQVRICRLMVKIGLAVDYAHQRGILHRDLKPANILLDEVGEPYISDFGLAKQLQSESDLTISGSVVGTPGYLAPELAKGKAKSATTLVDVYALGAILYYLLSGRPPFDGENPVEVLNQVINADPVPPSRWNSAVERDLETICLTCLEKEPSKRYVSARAMVEDLVRWQDRRPIHARPASTLERGGKWVRRHPMATALVLVILLSVVTVLFLSERSRQRLQVERDAAYLAEQAATTQQNRAESLSEELADRVVELKLSLAEDHFLSGRTGEGLAYLAQLMRETSNPRRIAHMAIYELSARNFLIPDRSVIQHESGLVAMEFSPDGQRLFTSTKNGVVGVWETTSGQQVARETILLQGLSDADLYPDGVRFVFGGSGGAGVARLVDDTLRVDVRLTDSSVTKVACSPDGEWLAVGLHDGRILVYDTQSLSLNSEFVEHDERISLLVFSPDATRLFSGGHDRVLRLWDIAKGRQLGRDMNMDTGVVSGRFNAAGDRVYTGAYDFTARAWDAFTGEPLTPPMPHKTVISAVDLDESGRYFATGSSDATVQLWDALTGERLSTVFRHDHYVKDVRFIPGGNKLVSASGDSTVRVWDWLTGESFSEPLYHATEVSYLALTRDGRTMATADRNGMVRIVNIDHARGVRRWSGGEWVDDVVFTPSGDRLLIGTKEGTVGFIDLRLGMGFQKLPAHRDEVPKIKFSADGKRFMSISWSGAIHIFETESAQLLLKTRVGKQLWDASFDRLRGRVYAGGGNGDGELFVIDELSGETLEVIREHTDDIILTLLSPGGEQLLTSSRDHSAILWNIGEDGTLHPAFCLRHDEIISAIDFDVEGTRVLTAALDNTAKVWDRATGRQIGRTAVHGGWVDHAEFSPDGKRFVTASHDNTARIWSSETGEALGPPMRHDGNVHRARFDLSGQRVVTGGNDGTIRLWDGHTGQSLSTPLHHRGNAYRTVVSSDGRTIAAAGPMGVSLWRLPLIPEIPVPEWLPDLVEAIGGLRYGALETIEWVPAGSLADLRERLSTSEPLPFYTDWLESLLDPSGE